MSDAPVEPALFVMSDGTGETAMAVARAAMTQFPTQWRLRTFSEVRTEAQAIRVIRQAAKARASVVFTIVDEGLASTTRTVAAREKVPCVDLLGPVISAISALLRMEPEHRAGLAHGFTDDYFRRVEAVEFAVRHDDGANTHSLHRADLVLTGVSRTSKTPLSMYLAQRGYKTGNVPLVAEVDPPRELLELDPRKVFGLVVDSESLIEIRRARVRALGASPWSRYADPEWVIDELRRARRLFRRQGWRTVDITGKAVEENAARIAELYQQNLDREGDQP